MKQLSSITLMLIALLLPSDSLAAEEKIEKGTPFEFFVVTYPGPEKVEFELVLQNVEKQPLTFEFATSQKFDIKVTDSTKKEVYLYSKGKAFTQALQNITLKPNEKKIWRVSWDYLHKDKRIPAGEYKVVGRLTAQKINDQPIDKGSLVVESTMLVPEENPVFRNIKVEGNKGTYKVTGEGRPIGGEYFYTVEDGHIQYIEETKRTTEAKYPNWDQFKLEIDIPEKKLPKNGTLMLHLYERSEKDGEIMHSFPVILERFY